MSRNVRRRTDALPTENEVSRFDALQLLITALFERFRAIELGGAGDCLFHVLLHLQNHEVPHANLAAAGAEVNENVALTRARIANHLEARTAAAVIPQLQEPTGNYVSEGMIAEHGSIEAYLEWIRRDGSPGGFLEVVAWVDLFKVHIRLISSTMIEGALVEEPVNARGASDDARTFHIFHQVGRGGVGGHYQLLQPTLPSPPPNEQPAQICEQTIAANGIAAGIVIDIATQSPSQ